MRPIRHVVQIILLAPALLLAPATAQAGIVVSQSSGAWDAPGTWDPDATPGPGDTVLIGDGHEITLPAGGATIANLMVAGSGELDFQHQPLTATGNVILGDENGPGTLRSTGSAARLDVEGDLTVLDAQVTDVDVVFASGGSDHSTTLAAGGASSWSGASLTQTGGTASLAGHAATGLVLALEDVAVAVEGENAIGGLTLSGTGSLAFRTPAGAAARLVLGTFSTAGTQAVTTTWTGTPASGASTDLITASTGGVGGLTADDDEHTSYTATATTLSAQHVRYANTAAPTVTSSNGVPDVAAPGDTLTCAPGTWSESSTYTYAWKRDGAAIPGATSSAYAVTSADEGRAITCAVTGTGTPASRTATASSAAITVPAAPRITITSAPPATVTTPATTLTYTPAPGTTIARCTLDGIPIACASPLTISGYANGSRPRVRIVGRNAADVTTAAEASFDVRLPPALTLGAPAAARGGEPVTVTIDTERGAELACAYAGATVPCSTDGVTVPAPPAGRSFALSVTATSATGTTTASRSLTSTAAAPLPSPVIVPVGERVTIPSSSFLGAGPGTAGYHWQGPLAVSFGGTFANPSSWAVRVAPAKAPGTYRQTLTWYSEPGDLNGFTIRAVDPAKAAGNRTLGGVTSAGAALTCPAAGPGTTYTWWVDSRLVPGRTRRTLPARAVPSTADVWCTARSTTSGRVILLRVLVDRGVRVAALPAGRMLRIATSDAATLEVVSLRGSERLAVLRVRARRGTLRAPVPAAARAFQVRVVRANGARSRPLAVAR